MFFFQAEDGIRDLVRSRGLGDVYKRQGLRRMFVEHERVFYYVTTMNENYVQPPMPRGVEQLSLIHI